VCKIENSAMKQLLTIPKIEIEKAFQNWQEQWNVYVPAKLAYFEGDKPPIPVSIVS
jgi:hypothetical protein